jgi:tRNA/rRNA methyltransferase
VTPYSTQVFMKTRFVLIQTSHAGNVGGVARAMKVMGFDDLVLVNPRFDNVLRREETKQRASGAQDVLDGARVVTTLEEALDGMTHVCATAMTPRDFGPPTRFPREHFQQLLSQSTGVPMGIAFLFGSERFGMLNEDVYRCHVALSIPTHPDFGSLNLASAAQVLAYEWRLALGGFSKPAQQAYSSFEPQAQERVHADAQEIAGLMSHWQESLVKIGFLDPLAPKKLMPRLQQIFNRAQLSSEEVHILRGVAKQMVPKDPIKRID